MRRHVATFVAAALLLSLAGPVAAGAGASIARPPRQPRRPRRAADTR